MLEESLIFFPTRYPDGFWNPPGLDFEDAWFTAADGTKLHGWYCPAPHPRAVLLFAHGNAGNLSHRFDRLIHSQRQLQSSILAFDYRGYGRSQGRPAEAGILADARAARQWLSQRAGVREARIVLLGESIGGAVMVDLAAGEGARGLILENTFSTLADVASYHFPWLPIRFLLRTRLDSVRKIGRYHGPLLMCHGSADRIVPLELAQRLFAAANEPKQLVISEGADHNDPPSEKYLQSLDRFLERLE